LNKSIQRGVAAPKVGGERSITYAELSGKGGSSQKTEANL
jgi:hypothetical protein